MLKGLRRAEENYDDGSQIAYLLQVCITSCIDILVASLEVTDRTSSYSLHRNLSPIHLLLAGFLWQISSILLHTVVIRENDYFLIPAP
jgi:hypothetical protein